MATANAMVDTTELESLLTTLRMKTRSGAISLQHLRVFTKISEEKRELMMRSWQLEEIPTPIMRRISLEPLLIPATDGTETIPAAKDVFTGEIDSDFLYELPDGVSNPTPETPIDLYRLVKPGATFEEIFGSFGLSSERMSFTHSQIIGFVKLCYDQSRTSLRSTLLLCKAAGKFFGVRIRFRVDERLSVEVAWCAPVQYVGGEDGVLVVVPRP